jgi:hypothetical protein
MWFKIWNKSYFVFIEPIHIEECYSGVGKKKTICFQSLVVELDYGTMSGNHKNCNFLFGSEATCFVLCYDLLRKLDP